MQNIKMTSVEFFLNNIQLIRLNLGFAIAMCWETHKMCWETHKMCCQHILYDSEPIIYITYVLLTNCICYKIHFMC